MEIANFEYEDYDQAIEFWGTIQGVSLNESDSPEAVLQFLNRNPGLSFVAKTKDGDIVGTVLCGHNGRAGQIYHLAVASSHRRQGLGKKLVDMCLFKLSQLNIPRCNIFVYTENGAGNEFWLNAGWNDPSAWRVLQKHVPKA